jgi:hypothetical protein
LKNTPRILQKQLPRRADLHSASKAVEQLEPDLPFQVLNLARERGLGLAQPLCGAPVMLPSPTATKLLQ